MTGNPSTSAVPSTEELAVLRKWMGFYEDAEPGEDVLAYLMATAENLGDSLYDNIKVKYQRGAELSIKKKRRKQKEQRELKLAAVGSRTSDDGFLIRSTVTDLDVGTSVSTNGSTERDEVSRQELPEVIQRADAVGLLEKKLRSKKTVDMLPQNIIQHQAVLFFFEIQDRRKLRETRGKMAQAAARCFGKGLYFAQKVVTWELQ